MLFRYYLYRIKKNRKKSNVLSLKITMATIRSYIQLFTGLFETFFFSGTVLGFFHMGNGVMINQGFWCNKTLTLEQKVEASNVSKSLFIDCSNRNYQERQAATHLTIGIAALDIGALFCGFLLDRFKIKSSRHFSMILIICGFIAMSQAKPGKEWVLFIAQPLLGIGGKLLGFVNLRDLPKLFPDYGATITTVTAGLLYSSASVWWGARKLISSSNGQLTNPDGLWSISYICYLLAGVSGAVIFLGTMFTLNKEEEKVSFVPSRRRDSVLNQIGWKYIPKESTNLRTYAFGKLFLCQVLWFNLNCQGYYYFVNNMWNWLGEKNVDKTFREKIIDNTGWMILASCLYSFCAGVMIDFIKHLMKKLHYALEFMLTLTSIINIVANFTGAFLPEDRPWKFYYIPFILHFIGVCWASSVNSTVIAGLFPEKYFGQLMGITEASVGVMCFVPVIVYGNTNVTSSFMAIVGGVLAAISLQQGALVWMERKKS